MPQRVAIPELQRHLSCSLLLTWPSAFPHRIPIFVHTFKGGFHQRNSRVTETKILTLSYEIFQVSLENHFIIS